MKINHIINEKYDPSKQYPDTEQGAIECFTDISEYSPNEITKVYPDPHTDFVWAVHTNTKRDGSKKHVVWLKDHDFATDDRSGDAVFNVNENASAGATASGAIATVAMPLGSGEVIRRSIYGENPTKLKKKKGKK